MSDERPIQELNKLAVEAGKIYDENLKNRPLGDQRAIQFNLMQRWYERLEPAGDVEVDMTLGNVRIRGFGSDKKAFEKFKETYPHLVSGELFKNETIPAGLSVSSRIPEIWIPNLKKDAQGNIVMPPHIMIHEFEHTYKQIDPRMQDPHIGVMNQAYEKPVKKLEESYDIGSH